MKRLYEMAATTPRRAPHLAARYGYASLQAFIDSIPLGATVADFGAGNSNLGTTVAEARGDVRWTNVDLIYGRPGKHRQSQRTAPPNLQYIAGDVLQPAPEIFEPGSVDRIYTSAMLPYLALSGRDLALRAVHNMADLLQPDGELRALPFYVGELVCVTAEQYAANPQSTAEQVVDATTLSPGSAAVQRLICVGGHYLGLNYASLLLGR